MINAKQEFLDHVTGLEVDYVKIYRLFVPFWADDGDSHKQIEGQMSEDLLHQLDFLYDDGHGWQELYGYIWYTDGSWSERQDYDGSEWWVHRVCPSKDISAGELIW